MNMRQRMKYQAVFAVVAAIGLTEANATTHELALTGVLANAIVYNWAVPEHQHTVWRLDLSGLDASNSIAVATGDFINVSSTLDQPFTVAVPPSSFVTAGQRLFGSFNAQSSTVGTIQLYRHGVLQASASSDGGSVGDFIAHSALFENATSLSFDRVEMSIEVRELSSLALLTSSELSWSIQSPVPEPSVTAMLTIGLILITLCRMRIKQSDA